MRTLAGIGPDAIDVSIIEAGGGGRPLLAVHGFTGAKEDFADDLETFAAHGWHVVAPDLRGHGSSSAPDEAGAYSLDRFAADLVGLVDHFGWDRFVLFGHSMGGMISQVVALDVPERLIGLVLMDTCPDSVIGVDPDLAAMGAALALDKGMGAVKEVQDALSESAPVGATVSEARQRLLAERPEYKAYSDAKFLNSSPHMYASMIPQLLDQEDRVPRLAGLDVPTLVMAGEQDEAFLPGSQRMADAIPGAELVIVSDAGHHPQVENRDEWWKAMAEFLRRVN